MHKEPLKIVVIGPESTGKSTLCRELAAFYSTDWCPEYAREYLLSNGKEYCFEDLLTIAKGQLALEDEFTAKVIKNSQKLHGSINDRPILFIDTDMYVMKVWSEFVFGKCHQWIIDQIVDRKYDLYLLCHTDLSWEKDELREYPDHGTRDMLFNMYKDIMINQSTPWADIYGTDSQRLETALIAVEELLKHQKVIHGNRAKHTIPSA
jgi:NadR type nicotinamide-nucleotide adenylyltransferase